MAKEKSENKEETTDSKKLYRSGKDRMLAGICGGLAEYFSVDATVIRIIAVVSILLGGLGLLAYIIAWIIIPSNPAHKDLDPKEIKCSTDPQLFWGVVLVVLGIFFLITRFDFFYFRLHYLWDNMWRFVWPLIIIVFGVFLMIKKPTVDTLKSRVETPAKGKLLRSKKNRMLAGICGGMAEYFNIDVSLVRIGWVIFALLSHGLGVIVYIILILVIPEEKQTTK